MTDIAGNTEVKIVSEATGKEVKPKKTRKRLFAFLFFLAFLIVVGTALYIRMIYLSDILYEIKVAELVDHYFAPAYITENGLIYTDYFSVRGLYLVFLSCLFKVFGNIREVIVFYDVALEVLALIFIFFGLRNIFGRVFAFIASLPIAAYPAIMIEYSLYCNTMYMLLWRDDRILYLGGAIAFWLLSLLILAIKKSIRDKKKNAGTESDGTAESDGTISESANDAADNRDVAAKEPEDYTYDNPYPYGSELKVVLSEDGMLVEEYKVIDPDGLIPPEVADRLDAEEREAEEAARAAEEVAKAAEAAGVVPDTEDINAMDNKADTEEEVELLINPLPGPKKHEHRDLDYDYDIPDSDMKFDIELDEG